MVRLQCLTNSKITVKKTYFRGVCVEISSFLAKILRRVIYLVNISGVLRVIEVLKLVF